MDSDIIATIGLLLDIVGVIILWRFGLPPSVDREGRIRYVAPSKDESEILKARRSDVLSRLAIVLILLGFALQIVALHFPSSDGEGSPETSSVSAGRTEHACEP